MPVPSAHSLRSLRGTALLLAALVPLALACGGGEDTPGDAAHSPAGEMDAAAGGGAADGSAQVGPPLTPEVLAAYLPLEIEGMAPRMADGNLVSHEELEGERARATETTMPYGGPTGPGVRVTIADLARTPQLEGRREIFQLMLDGETGLGSDLAEIERRDDGTIVVYRPDASQFVPAVEYFIGGRFHVVLRPQRDGRDVPANLHTAQALRTTYEDSPLPRLANGPDATPPEVTWPTDPEPAQARLAELPPCSVLLPESDVARICGVAGVEASPTGFEREGENCNRVYRREAGGTGVVFMVTNYGEVSQAADAVQVGAEPGEYSVEHDAVDVGDGGFAQLDRGGATPDRYALRFSSGGVLVEMNASDSPLDQANQKMCLTLDALEELGRVVATNLAEAGEG